MKLVKGRNLSHKDISLCICGPKKQADLTGRKGGSTWPVSPLAFLVYPGNLLPKHSPSRTSPDRPQGHQWTSATYRSILSSYISFCGGGSALTRWWCSGSVCLSDLEDSCLPCDRTSLRNLKEVIIFQFVCLLVVGMEWWLLSSFRADPETRSCRHNFYFIHLDRQETSHYFIYTCVCAHTRVYKSCPYTTHTYCYTIHKALS